MTPPTTLLTADEVAKEFRLDPETIRRWSRDGSISAIKLPGGQWRYRRADIQAFIDGDAGKGPGSGGAGTGPGGGAGTGPHREPSSPPPPIPPITPRPPSKTTSAAT